MSDSMHRLRQRLAGWHFAQESLTVGEREVLHVGEAVLKAHDALERERDELREMLRDARPYVYNVACEHRGNWRGQTAYGILAGLDAVIAKAPT